MIRRACVLASILGLFLQGSTGGHMLLVEHSRCVEHGELVHNSEAHAHVSAAHPHADLAAVHATHNGDSVHDVGVTDAFVAPLAARFRIAPKNSPPA
jgi:hypothetical protein